MTMLPQTPGLVVPRWPSRRSLGAAGALLTLAVFVFGASLTAPVSGQQEDTKKGVKKEKTSQEETKKEDLKKGVADKDETKRTDEEKEIDELVKEMARNTPGADADTLKRLHEQVQNMPPGQRKNMLRQMQYRRKMATMGQPPGGGRMAPGFAWPGRDARLGVRVDPPSDELAEQLDLPKGQGLVVREVVPESAAAKAGIKSHDILLELNGKAVANRVDQLARMVADIKPDTAVDVVVVRKGKKETIKDVKLPEAKATPGFPPGGFPGGAGQPPAGFPQTQPGFQQQSPFGIGGGMASVVTTMIRTQDRFTLRHQEGNLIITLTGQTADGKPKIKEIHVQDGLHSEEYKSVDKVPERYRDKVQNLIEMSEKGSARIDIKSP
jgi:membrane-associated protease RseP (regulator of RpoE activity)